MARYRSILMVSMLSTLQAAHAFSMYGTPDLQIHAQNIFNMSLLASFSRSSRIIPGTEDEDFLSHRLKIATLTYKAVHLK